MSALVITKKLSESDTLLGSKMLRANNSKLMASMRMHVKSMIGVGDFAKTENMTEKLAVIDKHLDTTVKFWRHTAADDGKEYFRERKRAH